MAKVLRFQDPKRHDQYVEFRAMLDAYKTERGCGECGYNGHPAALELDHRDPSTKLMKVAGMYSYSKEKIMMELEKCDVLCANCHQIKTFEMGEAGWRFPAFSASVSPQ